MDQSEAELQAGDRVCGDLSLLFEGAAANVYEGLLLRECFEVGETLERVGGGDRVIKKCSNFGFAILSFENSDAQIHVLRCVARGGEKLLRVVVDLITQLRTASKGEKAFEGRRFAVGKRSGGVFADGRVVVVIGFVDGAFFIAVESGIAEALAAFIEQAQ